MRKEFGKVRFISRTELTEGYLLRETKKGVVFEKYYDPEHSRVDVIAEFEGARINNDADFRKCLYEARKYEDDYKVTINIDVNPWNAAINQQGDDRL